MAEVRQFVTSCGSVSKLEILLASPLSPGTEPITNCSNYIRQGPGEDLIARRGTWEASEVSRMTRSLPATTSKTSPRVPLSSVKPHARASSLDDEVGLRPMATFVSVMPAASRESLRFWACAPSPERGSRVHLKDQSLWRSGKAGGYRIFSTAQMPRTDSPRLIVD